MIISHQSKSMTFRQTHIKKNLVLRNNIMRAIRQFFTDHNYLEVETPGRIPAPAPERHIDAEPSGDWFMHTSPELCMKRLLAAGYSHIFQICKCFRANERGRKHLPELTMLEWYTAGEDYHHMMAQCEALIRFVAFGITQSTMLTYQGNTFDTEPPWPRLTVAEAFERHGSISVTTALENDRFDEIMGLEIEPHLGLAHPVFLMDYPAQCGALARLKPNRPEIAERFELYMGGLELCNGFSELTDPKEQRQRFKEEMEGRRMDDKTNYPMPAPFLKALEHMPACTGNALGIDRLVMLLSDTTDIKDVVAFCPEEL